MSKERLEEMEELLNEYYENIDDPFASTDNAMAIVDKVGYFVKRVQELEEIIGTGNRREAFIKVYEQNKRYREALEKIEKEGTYGTSIQTGEVYRNDEAAIASKALEESE